MGRGDEPARYLIKTSRISVGSEELYIADFCLRYLNFGCFDADMTDLEIREFHRQGYYSFEDYAIAQWLNHVDSSTSEPLLLDADGLERLAQRIKSFLMKHGSDAPPDLSESTEQRFQSIRQWDFTKRLDDLAQLGRQRKSNESYLDLEIQLRRRRLIYEDMVTNADPLLLNGSGWFKCPKNWCESFSDGFQDKERRDKHVNQHARPFRCSLEECLHAELGFETEKDLKRHEKRSHSTDQTSEWAFPIHQQKKEVDIFSASKKGDLATVERLVRGGADVKQKSGSVARGKSALYFAVKYKHQHVVSYLIGQGCIDNSGEVFRTAYRLSPIAVIQMLFEMKVSRYRKQELAQEALRLAAVHGRKDALPLLLTYDININHIYQLGSRTNRVLRTALQIARSGRDHAFAQLLLESGALDESSEPQEPHTAQIGRVDAVGPPTKDNPKVNQLPPYIWPNKISKSLS